MTWVYERQPKEHVLYCNLCGTSEIDWEPTHDRYGLLVGVSACGCGLKFLNPRMTKEAYTRFYSNGGYRQVLSKFYGHPITAETIEKEQDEYAEKLSKLLTPHLMERFSNTLLDVGGSTGVVAARLCAEFGMAGTVLEPSTAEGKRACERGLSVLHGTVEDWEPHSKWGMGLLCQTVDHLQDIKGALKTIRAALEDGALFFVDYVKDCPIKVDHTFYLSEKPMRRYLLETGYLVLEEWVDEDGKHVDLICEAA